MLSAERPVYRSGRLRAIDLLELRAGDRVLDVGCGTGLNFPLLQERVGAAGRITGLDASSEMLAQARRRVVREGWDNVELLHKDAGGRGAAVRHTQPGASYDAALFTYALSIIGDWRDAWAEAVSLVVPGGRIAVVDLSLPSGVLPPLRWLARLACFTGGSDPHREPWRLAQRDLEAVTTEERQAGHVVLAVGSVPAVPRR